MWCYFRVKEDGVCMIYEGGIKEIKEREVMIWLEIRPKACFILLKKSVK